MYNNNNYTIVMYEKVPFGFYDNPILANLAEGTTYFKSKSMKHRWFIVRDCSIKCYYILMATIKDYTKDQNKWQKLPKRK